MTNLPSQHPTLSLHLSDVTLTPLITSSSSQAHLESLTSLTTSALTSQTAAQRLGLGRPQRLMVEYPDRGPVVLHSYLDPRDAAADSTTSAAAVAVAEAPPAPSDTTSQSDETRPAEDAAPMLVGVVVAGSADDAREARRAAVRLERMGRDFQREWAAESGSGSGSGPGNDEGAPE